MPRPHEQEPTIDERGDECHPAFGTISVTRTSGGNRSLFQSDLQHNETITLRVNTATRKRDLGRDWIHPDDTIVEVEMSLSQWGQVVSSIGLGAGTPVTLTHRPEPGARIIRTPGIPFAPRIAANLDEVRGSTAKLLARVAEAADEIAEAVEAKSGIRVLREKVANLRRTVDNAPSNAEFTVTSLAEAAEAVTDAATADIEAKILSIHAAAGSPAVDPALLAPIAMDQLPLRAAEVTETEVVDED